MSKSSKRFRDFLNKIGYETSIKNLSDSTRTSLDAARAIGCEISEIAKSILFRGEKTNRPILVIASGGNRINEDKIKSLAGEPVTKADADFVREQTGFVIGGVPPFGEINEIVKLIDKNILNHKIIWAAAGTPNSVFSLTPENLIKITKGRIIDIS